jgi:hypothetical protein
VLKSPQPSPALKKSVLTDASLIDMFMMQTSVTFPPQQRLSVTIEKRACAQGRNSGDISFVGHFCRVKHPALCHN